MTATWQTNVLVAATPISRPARVNSTPSASRVACEPIDVGDRQHRRAALARQAHRRQRVGGLARLRDPDHEVARGRRPGCGSGTRRRCRSRPAGAPTPRSRSGRSGRRGRRCRRRRSRSACTSARIASSSAPSSSRSTPSPRAVRSAIVSATASACSWISFSMNVSKPPFSAVSSSQSTVCDRALDRLAGGRRDRARRRGAARRSRRSRRTARGGSPPGTPARPRRRTARPRRGRRSAGTPCARRRARSGSSRLIATNA